jgi:hypothetical protein
MISSLKTSLASTCVTDVADTKIGNENTAVRMLLPTIERSNEAKHDFEFAEMVAADELVKHFLPLPSITIELLLRDATAKKIANKTTRRRRSVNCKG